MIGVGILPLAIATWLWAGAIRDRAPAGRGPTLVRGVTIVSAVLGAVGLVFLAQAFVAVRDAPADVRSTLLAQSISGSMAFTAAAFATQTAALLATAWLWFHGRRAA